MREKNAGYVKRISKRVPAISCELLCSEKGLKVLLGLTDFIGLPLEIYMPEEGLAIETTVGTEEIELIKEHLCKQRSIRRRILPYKGNGNEAEYAEKIKRNFKVSIFSFHRIPRKMWHS